VSRRVLQGHFLDNLLFLAHFSLKASFRISFGSIFPEAV
jgi:hypothetical protein